MTDSPLVLVIEDEAALTTLLRYNLESHGFRVAAIGNGADAMGEDDVIRTVRAAGYAFAG